MAAIQQIMAKEALMSGNNSLMIRPNVAPTKNKGIIKPPRQPEVTVIEMAVILKNKIANNMDRVKDVFKSSFTSWWLKYLVIGKTNEMQPNRIPPINILR